MTSSLGNAKYVVLTTFRKDGTPVPTPVWAATDGDELLVLSERKAGKVKRIRRDGKVLVQACDVRGRNAYGPELTGTAQLVEDVARVRQALVRQYGIFVRVSMFFSRLRPPRDRTIGIAVRF
ncbi:PPOX class F420-dependent oxidoreductase [Amycolatopsis pithecellobii]|uniref:PPOX class F420-dependent oxidoreductase n=1 Tax=Amycolatopsis pithecellobii TaxID=664692 RepID=A0A6N7Z1B3_9PSEU|nr:PPOX class F420-dependent oxidoreductase [Amycolatopsis pithecellobii]MTD53631.1 PPOX class F420-dependent oxidoreductase [Amycolatopsis pithecellobii]